MVWICMAKAIGLLLALAHVSHFFPNDLRCGFRKLKERGVGNRTSGAVLVPKSLLYCYCYSYTPGAGRDLILPTQRIRDIKISMVWICMVKVICLPLALAHVSHFFPSRSRGPTSNRHLFHFSNFLKFYSCQLCFCLCLPVSHFFQNERRGPTSNRRVLQFL